MKTDAAGPALRKLTENLAALLRHSAVPLQKSLGSLDKFYEDFALLVFPADGWAVGVHVKFTPDAWSIAEVVLLPVFPAAVLPSLGDLDLRPYIDEAVRRARDRQQAAAAQVKQVKGNAAFVQKRFDAWRDKAAPKTNIEYAALAAKYAEQVQLGNSRATATLAGLVDMSPAVMAQRIKEARRRFLLTPGERGRVSGALTPLGALLTDPDFPGFRQLQVMGLTPREIAERYGISERYVWHGLEEELGPNEGDLVISREEEASLKGFKRRHGRE
ncbi:hypothetical protein [Paenarthrobacter ureafaciens]|uniref:hypothetical protein n=1 Tax=Paenarthrobacter ureafaciens TaxID=37931 RepID=UPI002DC0581C|nr:hypothetical protein [Paenarthrobacter ureafaciens]MEC3853726.1 hypothetical protein [Paenarthrobacter ureafaciens]